MKFVSLFSALVLSMALTACSDGEPGPETDAKSESRTNSATKSETAAETKSAGGLTTENLFDAMAKAHAAASSATTSLKFAGEANEFAMKGTTSWGGKPEDSKLDFTTSSPGGMGDARIIVVDEVLYATSNQGARKGKFIKFELSAVDGVMADRSQFFDRQLSPGPIWIRTNE